VSVSKCGTKLRSHYSPFCCYCRCPLVLRTSREITTGGKALGLVQACCPARVDGRKERLSRQRQSAEQICSGLPKRVMMPAGVGNPAKATGLGFCESCPRTLVLTRQNSRLTSTSLISTALSTSQINPSRNRSLMRWKTRMAQARSRSPV
jgi:hypothetical protein